MKKFSIKISLGMIGVYLLLAACGTTPQKESRVDALPYYDEASFTPKWLASDDPALDTLHRVSEFDLINQEGDSISEETFADKIYVTDFFFTFCPGICPKMTSNMSLVQKSFVDDDEVLLLSHSVAPEKDSVHILKEYAEAKGVLSHKWHLATGNRKQIYKMGRKEYFIEEDLGLEKKAEEFIHTENFVLVDKNRYIRGIYNGLSKTSVNQLIADIQTLKRE